MLNAEPTAPPSMPTIRGEKVYLRPTERDDLPRFVRWFADDETTRFLGTRVPFSLAMEERWFDTMLERQGKNAYHFVICLLADGRPIGTTGFHHVDLENGGGAFGIVIGEKEDWSKGYGTDALRAMCDFGFGILRLERIELDVYEPNRRAQRSYEKAGFVVEGTLRNAHFAEGRHWDVLRMSLLRSEWEAGGRARSWELNQPA